MKGKTFLILLVAAVLLAAAAMLSLQADKNDGAKMGAKLLADLPVNQVATVTITDGENRTTLTKGESVWQVEERDGYPADFEELRDTVVKLSRLKIGRSFSGSAESLARLSLENPSNPDASARGKQITLEDASGKTLADLVVGQTRTAEGGGSGGQYVKKADGDTVFLVDASFRFLKTAPAEWLEKEILHITSEAVQSVACFAGEEPEPVYTLTRSAKDQDVELTPLPKGRAADANRIDQVMDALAPLSLDDVQPAQGSPDTAAHHRLVYRLYDGREITIYPMAEGKDRYTLRVAARQVAREMQADAKTKAQAPGDTMPEDNIDEKDEPAIRTAQDINAAVGPWLFSIKKWQYDSLVTQPESLLEEIKKDG